MTQNVAIWAIAALSIAGVICRPKGWPEWIWAFAGATALVLFGLLPWHAGWRAAAGGLNVYLFLGGMMLLAELARSEGVFDWLALHAIAAARGSRLRLFALVYGIGIAVTIVLSNDATAVVLTPAVADVVRKAKVPPLPHLFACAFIANAASFVLPISNPANLVIFGAHLPPLLDWLRTFALPSLLSIGATYAVLAFVSRRDLRGPVASAATQTVDLGRAGAIALGGIALTALALVVASYFSVPLGAVTFACAALVLGLVALAHRSIVVTVVRGVSWGVLVLVAGLFVLVAGLESTGLLALVRSATLALAQQPAWRADSIAGWTTALVSNLTNNLPAGLLAGAGLTQPGVPLGLKAAVAVGIDLGPNLSVTGSLATILWLIALRRANVEIDAWRFLRTGALVMPPALLLTLGALALVSP